VGRELIREAIKELGLLAHRFIIVMSSIWQLYCTHHALIDKQLSPPNAPHKVIDDRLRLEMLYGPACGFLCFHVCIRWEGGSAAGSTTGTSCVWAGAGGGTRRQESVCGRGGGCNNGRRIPYLYYNTYLFK
jgi:hypothetical protein